jgi:putative addiction module killer protein
MEVRQTAAFRRWFARLRDIRAQAQIVRRIERAQAGNLGDAKSLGEGLTEMRIHYGPGYRLYVAQRGLRLLILLCGGDKASQAADIVKARAMLKDDYDEA